MKKFIQSVLIYLFCRMNNERDVQENIFAMNESQSIDSLRAMEEVYVKRYP